MATVSNTPRPGYVWDATDNCWYPIGTGPHSHADYITAGSAINPNIVDAKGDIIAATAADTVARLAVGSNDQVLTADSSTATGLKWATPASGGMTSIATGTLSGSSVVLGSIPGTYNSLILELKDWYNANNGEDLLVRITGVTSNYGGVNVYKQDTTYAVESSGATAFTTNTASATENVDNNHYLICEFPNYADSSSRKLCLANATYETNGNVQRVTDTTSYHNTATAISSLTISPSAGNFSGGTYTLWGIK